ncbi:hypothetical protein, partial [Rhizobium leguminosarum]|uniref:hypothetical protein n=1 Tax=Rhizobium leguminosarum TaxID=384 RepID=UPI003D078AEE
SNDLESQNQRQGNLSTRFRLALTDSNACNCMAAEQVFRRVSVRLPQRQFEGRRRRMWIDNRTDDGDPSARRVTHTKSLLVVVDETIPVLFCVQ